MKGIMVLVDSGNPDRWLLRTTLTWCNVGLSAVFCAMGVLAWYRLPPFSEGPDSWRLLAAPFLLGVAVVPVSWRVAVTVDRREGTVTASYGLFVPMFSHTIDIAPKSVRLERSMYFDCDSNNTIYHDILLQTSSWQPIYVGQIPDAMRAHAIATELALFLNVPLVDQTELIRIREYWLCFDPWFAARPIQARYLKIGPDGLWQKAYENPKDWQVGDGQT